MSSDFEVAPISQRDLENLKITFLITCQTTVCRLTCFTERVLSVAILCTAKSKMMKQFTKAGGGREVAASETVQNARPER